MGTTTQPKEPCEICGKPTYSKYRVCSQGECRLEQRRRDGQDPTRTKSRFYRQRHPQEALWSGAKWRANKYGIPFDLEISDIIIPDVCPLIGIPLTQNTGTVHRASPSVDRIIPELGYIRGNIQVISYKANTMKNDATPEQLLRFADWIYKTFKEAE
jgi:hypothetical protein